MGADVNARSPQNQTPLHLSVHNDQEQLVKKLIMNGAFALIVDQNQQTPRGVSQQIKVFSFADEDEDLVELKSRIKKILEIAEKIQRDNGALKPIGLTEKIEMQWYHNNIHYDAKQRIKSNDFAYLMSEPDEEKEEKNSVQGLISAINRQDNQAVKEILDLGKVNIERKFGQNYRSSLNWACYSGAKECCVMLLNKKANKESADTDKNTPLLTAMAR